MEIRDKNKIKNDTALEILSIIDDINAKYDSIEYEDIFQDIDSIIRKNYLFESDYTTRQSLLEWKKDLKDELLNRKWELIQNKQKLYY